MDNQSRKTPNQRSANELGASLPPADAVIIALVRLLARQAAREYVEPDVRT
jgi:hypothetical protein